MNCTRKLAALPADTLVRQVRLHATNIQEVVLACNQQANLASPFDSVSNKKKLDYFRPLNKTICIVNAEYHLV